jgi:hypothetical protein
MVNKGQADIDGLKGKGGHGTLEFVTTSASEAKRCCMRSLISWSVNPESNMSVLPCRTAQLVIRRASFGEEPWENTP